MRPKQIIFFLISIVLFFFIHFLVSKRNEIKKKIVLAETLIPSVNRFPYYGFHRWTDKAIDDMLSDKDFFRIHIAVSGCFNSFVLTIDQHIVTVACKEVKISKAIDKENLTALIDLFVKNKIFDLSDGAIRSKYFVNSDFNRDNILGVSTTSSIEIEFIMPEDRFNFVHIPVSTSAKRDLFMSNVFMPDEVFDLIEMRLLNQFLSDLVAWSVRFGESDTSRR